MNETPSKCGPIHSRRMFPLIVRLQTMLLTTMHQNSDENPMYPARFSPNAYDFRVGVYSIRIVMFSMPISRPPEHLMECFSHCARTTQDSPVSTDLFSDVYL